MSEGGLMYEAYRAECLSVGVGNTRIATGCVSATAGECCTMGEFLKHIDRDRSQMTDANLGRDPTPQEVRDEMLRSGENRGKYQLTKLFPQGAPGEDGTHTMRLLHAMKIFKEAANDLVNNGKGELVKNSFKYVNIYRQAAESERLFELRDTRYQFAKSLALGEPPTRDRQISAFDTRKYPDVDFRKMIKWATREYRPIVSRTIRKFENGLAGNSEARLHQRIVSTLRGPGLKLLSKPKQQPAADGSCKA